MTDLVVWLRQQLDSDERRARRAGGTHPDWSYDRETFTVFAGAHVIAARKAAGSPLNDVDGEHIANNDPDRVLRQVQAHRAILDIHAIVWRDIGWLDHEREYRYGEVPVCGHCVQKHSHFQSWDEVPEGACATVKALVSIYSDRDGYNPEWSA